MKYQTEGLDPKIPSMALTIIIVFVISKLGIDLPVYVSLAVATVVGSIAGFFSPAAKTKLVPDTKKSKLADETGQYDPMYILLFLVVLIVVVWLVMHLFGS